MAKDDGAFEGMTQEEIERALQDDEYRGFDRGDEGDEQNCGSNQNQQS